MKYFWSFFFLAWPIAAVVFCAIAPSLDLWLPPRHLTPGATTDVTSVNPLGREIDSLFYMILWITGIVFVLTQGALAWVLFSGERRAKRDRPARFVHGNNRLELIWTIVPGLILLFIAYDQLDVWTRFRVVNAFPKQALAAPLAEIEAHQFGWKIRYPAGNDTLEREPQPSDLYDHDRLYIPVGEPVLIWLSTRDVIHSFFVPQFRIKQDALPGQMIPIWFQADEPGRYQFLCAELCGWGHYDMGGMIIAQKPKQHAASMKALAAMNHDDGVAEKGP